MRSMKNPEQPEVVSPGDGIIDTPQRENEELPSSEEAQLHEAFAPAKHSLKERLKLFFLRWWNSKPARYGSITGLALLILLVIAVAPLRNGVLNTAGVRGTLAITVTDKTNNAPLQNAQVQIAGKSKKTSRSGQITITDLKLGNHELIVRKNAFAVARLQVTVGTGKAVISAVPLRAVGAQYSIEALDYLTGKTLVNARASSGKDANANADSQGKLVLTVKAEDDKSITVKVSADEYKDTTLKIAVGSTELQRAVLVPKVRHIFASNASGVLGIYTSDIDGKNRTEIFSTKNAGSMNTPQIRTTSDSTKAAVVSKKDGITNADGYALDALSIVQLTSTSTKTIERAESIQLLDWQGNTLVYQYVESGLSAANPQRSKIVSYNVATDKKTLLVAANYFVGFELIKDQVYYALSATDPSVQSSFMQIGIDGKNRQLLVRDSVWGLYRKSYTTIVLQTQSNGWKSYDTTIHKTSASSPNDYMSYAYTVSSDGKQLAHTETRDGRNIIIVTDVATKKETVLAGIANASRVRWLSSNILMYSVSSPNETADYVTDSVEGSAKKITDVVYAN